MTDKPQTTEKPTAEELLDAAATLSEAADGHCSFGAVPSHVAAKRRRVADWLKDLAR